MNEQAQLAPPSRTSIVVHVTSTKTLRVAAVQLQSTDDVIANLESCEHCIAEAADRGAEFVVLPENFAYFGANQGKRAIAESLTGPAGPIRNSLVRSASQLGLTILAGGWPELSSDPDRPFNSATLFLPDGSVKANYRKFDLFDVTLPSGDRIQESSAMMAGSDIVCADVNDLRVGLSICYDLRFPELYRKLVDRGSQVLCIPSAFTRETGQDHWHMLVRTRAVESQCWVIAANQWGVHPNGKETYGHSLIVDPWGSILAEVESGIGVIVADLELQTLGRVRSSLPCLRHRRLG